MFKFIVNQHLSAVVQRIEAACMHDIMHIIRSYKLSKEV